MRPGQSNALAAVSHHIPRGGLTLHRLLDLVRSLLRGCPRVDRNAAVEPAPRRDRRGPVAAFDAPDVQVDRMRLAFKVFAAGLAGIPLGLELAQRADDAICRVDRI